MMIGNTRAQQLFLSGLGRPVSSLSNELLAILEQGVMYREEPVVLSHSRQPLTSFSRDALYDEVGVECLINHLHLDDYETLDDEVDAFQKCLAAARLLHKSLQKIGCKAKILISVAGVVDVTLRFHKVRPGQEWLASDLEGYDSAVLVLES